MLRRITAQASTPPARSGCAAGRLRALALASMLAAVLALVPSAAGAHGGALVYTGEAGPYLVESYRSSGGTEGWAWLDYTLFLRDAADGRPVDGATVVVTALRGRESFGPVTASVFANQYEAVFEVPSRDGQWVVEVRIEGPRGTATLSHPLAPPPGPSTFTTVRRYALWLLGAAALWFGTRP